MKTLLDYNDFITEEFKSIFQSPSLETLENKLDKQMEKYVDLHNNIDSKSLYELRLIASLVYRISSTLHDLSKIIRNLNTQKYDTKYDGIINSILDKCKTILKDYKNNDRLKKYVKYKRGIEMIQLVEDSFIKIK